MDGRKRLTRFSVIKFYAAVLVAITVCGPVSAQSTYEIYEIWTPEFGNQSADSSFGTSVFHKSLQLIAPEEAEIYVAARDNFELYINEQIAYRGRSNGQAVKLDVIDFLHGGINSFALKVTHINSTTAGVAVKFRVRETGENRWRGLKTDDTWQSSISPGEKWFATEIAGGSWQPAKKLASFTINVADVISAQPIQPTAPPAPSPAQSSQVAANSNADSDGSSSKSEDASNGNVDENRFSIDEEFQVQQIMLDSETGSLIAMAFNEFGDLILSQEGGPLMLADISKKPNEKGRIRVICDEVSSCQGILPLNGRIYVTGDGPSGVALYLLSDSDRDGRFSVEQVIVPFAGKLGEHGPHGIQLGPDGLIYVTVGNASKSNTTIARTSPYFHTYEGDLVPRIEDPGGHAVGVKAPGGTVIRTTLDGSKVEMVAGGLRNIYDLAFDKHGELFLHDSDLETNKGMAWYRPTRIYHAYHGAELGWRSGWSKFPDYFTDVTPPVAETGRGSPSGAVAYEHFQFPARYHNTLFFADWSEGRILNAKPRQSGAGYEMDVEEFCTGRPLNVTDLDVGTDGTLFFCTGGRGTGGGVYRIAWGGEVPEELYTYSNEYERIIRMPQPNSAWGRQAVASLKTQLGKSWKTVITGIAEDQRNETDYRLRAIELMFFYGPFPKADLVAKLAADEDFRIRARIASLCGAKKDEELNANLDILVSDSDALVRRRAAESYFRIGQLPPIGSIMAMLASKDRTEAAVARRLIERARISDYQQAVLKTEDLTTFVNGSIAILTANPNLESSYLILARVAHFMDGYMQDTEFADVLRVAQLALVQGNVDPNNIPGFGDRISAEFPAGSGILNKQLTMIMAFMKNSNAESRVQEYFETTKNSPEDKLFVAMMLQTIGRKLDENSRFAVLDALETAIKTQQGTTYQEYIGTAIKQLVQTGTPRDQIQRILKNGGRWPNAMLQSFFLLRERLTAEQVEYVIAADRQIPDSTDLQIKKVRLGNIAMLAESKSPVAHEYLREIWQTRPAFRNEICLGLAQMPEGANWAYLVTSMPVLDDTMGIEVVKTLRKVSRRPKKARQYRELIELGYRLREAGGLEVSKLMRHWTGEEIERVSTSGKRWELAMDHWVQWYNNEWPNDEPVNLESLVKVGGYNADQVLAHLEEFEVQGNPSLGKQVFNKANCVACHRVGNEGATFGPDLGNLAGRFSRREILESIIEPSRVVSDQYKSKKILTADGEQLFGMLIRDSSSDYLLQDSEGRTLRISESEIEEIADSEKSSMPDGLLDTLTLDEILHLFAYLNRGRSTGGLSQQRDSGDFIR